MRTIYQGLLSSRDQEVNVADFRPNAKEDLLVLFREEKNKCIQLCSCGDALRFKDNIRNGVVKSKSSLFS